MRPCGCSLLFALALGCASSSAPPPKSDDDRARDALREPLRNELVGRQAPAFRAKNMSGGPPLTLVPDKVNVIAFWATWSAPDQRLLGDLDPIWEKLGRRGLVITALSIDDDERFVVEVARDERATYDIGWDASHEIFMRYRPGTEPALYVVDRKGIVRFVHYGYHDGEHEDIAREVESLL